MSDTFAEPPVRSVPDAGSPCIEAAGAFSSFLIQGSGAFVGGSIRCNPANRLSYIVLYKFDHVWHEKYDNSTPLHFYINVIQ